MYIESLYIKNFRSIDYLHLKLTKGKNVVVGKNNAGKSNIVKALDLSFGVKNPLYADISYTDFHDSEDDACEEFWILSQLKETDINEEELLKIKGVYRGQVKGKPFTYTDEVLNIVHEHTIFNPDTYYTGYEKTYFKPNNNLNVLIESIKKSRSLMVLFHVKSCEEAEGAYDKDYRFFYQEEVDPNSAILQKDAPWYVLWGISTTFRDALITSAILPAFREPVNQLKPSNWSWYGKLLKKVWEDKRAIQVPNIGPDAETRTIEELLKTALGAVEDIGNSVYSNLAADISSKIKLAFRETFINFQYFHNPKDIYKQVQVFVNDGFNSNLQNKGSGIQSAIIIGLFSYYCSLFHHNTTILAIEEPELYLHPQARRVISNRLSEFVNVNAGKQNQVIVITHSTEFIKAGELNNISVIKKSKGKTKSNYFNIENSNKSQIQTLLRSENSEMFFADAVIICEGGEKFILPAIADSIAKSKEYLDECNITIARANGKNDILKICHVLKKCGIPYFALADLDFLFEGMPPTLHDSIGPLRSAKTAIIDAWSSKNLDKRLFRPDKSTDAKAFCEMLDIVENDPQRLPDLIKLWQYLKPKVKSKITHKEIEEPENIDFKNNLYKCLNEIWQSESIYILKRGELEDYLTETGKKVEGTKETRLLNIIELVNNTGKIEEYFHIDEFIVFFKTALRGYLPEVFPLEKTSDIAAQALGGAAIDSVQVENASEFPIADSASTSL